MKLFDLKQHGTTVKREVIAGFTTYSTMAYILFVNPQILSGTGMDFDAVMFATAVSAAIATLTMGLLANYPFALASGMGLNAYFTYGIVQSQGHTWQAALGACFWAGLIFLFLNAVGIRKKILNAIPSSIRIATIGGLGFFLAFIGLKQSGIVVPDETTAVALGDLRALDAGMTFVGLVMISVLMIYRIPGAILLSVLFSWLCGILLGDVPFEGIFSLPPNPAPTFLALDIKGALLPEFWPVILSFVLIAFFDTAGTLMGLADQANLLDKGKLPRAGRALTADAIGTTVGSLLGTSPLTTYLESAAGISSGGRTGLTAVVTAILLLASLFAAPLAKSIPLYATAPVLILIGSLMIREIRNIDWDDLSEALPCFLVMISIPLTFSIATGIALGLILFAILKLFTGKGAEVPTLIWIIAILFSMKFLWS